MHRRRAFIQNLTVQIMCLSGSFLLCAGHVEQAFAISVAPTPGAQKLDGHCHYQTDAEAKARKDPDADCSPVGILNGTKFEAFDNYREGLNAAEQYNAPVPASPTLPAVATIAPTSTAAPVVFNMWKGALLLGAMQAYALSASSSANASVEGANKTKSAAPSKDDTYGQYAGSPEDGRSCPPGEGPTVVSGSPTCAPCDAYVVNVYQYLHANANRDNFRNDTAVNWDAQQDLEWVYYHNLKGPLADDIRQWVKKVEAHTNLMRRFYSSNIVNYVGGPNYSNNNQVINLWNSSPYRYLDMGPFQIDTAGTAWHGMHMEWNAPLGRYLYSGKTIMAALHYDLYTAMRARWSGLWEPWGFGFADFANLTPEFKNFLDTRFDTFQVPDREDWVMAWLIPANQAPFTWHAIEYRPAEWLNKLICILIELMSPDSPISVILDEEAFASTPPVEVEFALNPNTPSRKALWRGSGENPLLVWIDDWNKPEFVQASLETRSSKKIQIKAENLFGKWTFGGKKRDGGKPTEWRDGFEALGTLDGNGDAKISGQELARLALWADRNRDGRVDEGEIETLDSKGITSLFYKNPYTLANADIRLDKGFERSNNDKKSFGALVDWVDSGLK